MRRSHCSRRGPEWLPALLSGRYHNLSSSSRSDVVFCPLALTGIDPPLTKTRHTIKINQKNVRELRTFGEQAHDPDLGLRTSLLRQRMDSLEDKSMGKTQ